MRNFQNIIVVDKSKSAVNRTIQLLEDFNVSARFFKEYTVIGVEKILAKEDIDLIILELNLESYRGYDTYKAVQNVADDVPILIYSEVQNEVLISQALRLGALDFLVKSEVRGKQFARTIRNASQKHQKIMALVDAQADLKQSQSRYREAQKIASFGDWTLDFVTGDMSWSSTMYTVFQLPVNESIKSREDFINLIYQEDRAQFTKILEDATRTGELQEAILRIKSTRGFKYLKTRAKMQMLDSIGGLLAIVGTCQDVTTEVQSQSAIIAQHVSGHTKKVQKEMLAHLGFNIRTQMGAMMNLFYLFEETKVNQEQKGLLTSMKTSFDGMNEELHQFLNSTMMYTSELKAIPQKIHLRNFLNGFKSFVKVNQSNVIDLILDDESNLPDYILVDGDKLQQVLINIVHAFGDVSLRNERNIRMFVSSSHQKSTQFKLNISIVLGNFFPYGQDESIFIDPNSFLAKAAIDAINYEKVDTDLAVASKLIQTMNGEMDFIAKAKSTQFSFKLPAQQIVEGEAVDVSKPLYPMHILLVEDHVINQIATKKILERWGDVSVVIAKNGKVAIDELEKHHFDLVLMDIQMPILDGITATKIIRKTNNLPIIALTAHASTEERNKCLDVGMNNYMTKPFKPKELYRLINETQRNVAELGA